MRRGRYAPMKILLMGFAKMKYMPYMHFYLNQINRQQHEVHLLYWNRDCQPEESPRDVICHEFAYSMEDDIPKLQKLRGFRGYRNYAIQLLNREKFDLIVVMHSLPGVLLSGYLTRNYRNRFIFDYRDYTYENLLPYRRIIHKLVKASRVTFVSSDGFRFALPASDKIYTSHNMLPDAEKHRQKHERRESLPIRIVFWGYIRHEELNRKIIERLAGDPRFELCFYGREQAVALRLKEYACQINAENVRFFGAYDPGEQDGFAAEADLLHNLYSNTEAPSQSYAMTNKYYDGVIYRLPQLCMKDSFMGSCVEQENIGLVCDPSDADFADQIWSYYQQLDMEHFRCRCDAVLQRICQEYNLGRKVIENAIYSLSKSE